LTAVHKTAKHGFVRGDVYEAGRPSYPPAVVTALVINAATRVCDLGCGTGKFTRLVRPSGAKVIGVEPLPAMLSEFRKQTADVPVVAGVGEALPLRGSVFDVVVCASVFHWLAYDLALPEIHRVLRPGGRLGIVWNRRDDLTGWPAAFWEITEEYRGNTPGYRSDAWRRALDDSPLFGPVAEQWFDHVQRTDHKGAIARVASISFIETLPDDKREAVLDAARRFLAEHPETRDRAELELPYKTTVYTVERINGS
jgi:SAM-dependent methyltransferase